MRGLLAASVGPERRRAAAVTWGGAGRLTAAVRDVAWYPVGLPLRARSRATSCTARPSARRCVRRVPVVVTVHDLAVLRHPEASTAGRAQYGAHLLLPRLRAARRVIAVSEFTQARGGRACWAFPRSGCAWRAERGRREVFAPRRAAADGEYVLAVGTLEPRKNLPRLVEAAGAPVSSCASRATPGWGGVEVAGAARHLARRVTDEELAALPRGALCLAYPSLYEGFGIPVLEAMACGAPVVTSAGGAMQELAGGAAELVDPADLASIAAGIERALGRRDELRAARARARAALHVGGGGGGGGDRLPEGGRMSAPLVLLDADVLGRRRTGDETYVANLLAELRARSARRAAARRRHAPSRARAGRSRADRAAGAEPGAAHGGRGAARSCGACDPSSRTSSTRSRRCPGRRQWSPSTTSRSSATRGDGRSTRSRSGPSCRARRVGRRA